MGEASLQRAFEALRPIRAALTGPQGPILLSAALLTGFWFGGAGLLLALGVAVPAALAVWDLAESSGARERRDGLTGLAMRPTALRELALILAEAPRHGRSTGCFLVEIDEFASLRRTQEQAGAQEVVCRVAERLLAAVREGDVVARLDEGRFAVIPAGLRGTGLEAAIQLSARLQAAVAEPISLNATRVYVTACVGFALPRDGAVADSAALFEAAEGALTEAARQGPGTIRAFSPSDRSKRVVPGRLVEEVDDGFDSGAIQAWFQPQVSTDTGEVTGMEALARWVHPVHGTLAPGEFLPAVAAAGRMDRLGARVLQQSLSALADWESHGLQVPCVGVNFNEDDLRDPSLPERVKWEIDRFDLKPQRLVVEILETVLTPSEDDMVTRNILKLSQMGVGLDLDDFGTGTASISAIRRFDVHRIKIDRSFVTKIDQDRSQQDMVAAILSMAERLGLHTLAEGVETHGEHAMLAQLGCSTVQGFCIAAPMPLADTYGWMERNAERVAESRALGRRVI